MLVSRYALPAGVALGLPGVYLAWAGVSWRGLAS